MIADNFYRFRFLSIDYSWPVCEHTWNFTEVVFEGVADLNHDKLGAYKPDHYKPSEDFKPDVKEKNIF